MHIVYMLLAFILLFSAVTQTQAIHADQFQIKQFIQKQLKINLQQVEKFVVKKFHKLDRFDVAIEKGRKKTKIILQALTNEMNTFKLMFMEQIATFGNEKSFLNIRTSTGSKQPLLEQQISEQQKNSILTSNNQQLFASQNSIINSTQPQKLTINISNPYMARIHTFISNNLDKADLSSLELMQQNLNELTEYKIKVKINSKQYLLILGKQIGADHKQKLAIKMMTQFSKR